MKSWAKQYTRGIKLNEQDIEALRLTADGKTVKEVADGMGKSENQVRHIMRRIYAALDARHAAHAVHIMWKKGLQKQ